MHAQLAIVVTIWQLPPHASLALILQIAIAAAKLQMRALLALAAIILLQRLHAFPAPMSRTALHVAKLLTPV